MIPVKLAPTIVYKDQKLSRVSVRIANRHRCLFYTFVQARARTYDCKFTTPGSYYSNISKYSTLYVAAFPLTTGIIIILVAGLASSLFPIL